MICIETMGGLGNQLFVYAFARSIQMDTEESIEIYDFHRSRNPLARCQLKAFIPPGADAVLVDKRPAELLWSESCVQSFLFRAARKVWRMRHPSAKQYEMEKALQPCWNKLGICLITDGYIPFSRKTVFSKYICWGYFQSPRFWGRHMEDIRAELLKPELIPESRRDILAAIRMSNAVCLHMRFGDYVNDEAVRRVHYVCGGNYYRKAIEKACAELREPTFFVFTNDEAAAKATDFRGANTFFVPTGDAVGDMQLMAQCKHFIIPNSSYSWWGQFLSDYPEKRVYAPERWFRDERKPADMYMDNWTKIPVELPPL